MSWTIEPADKSCIRESRQYSGSHGVSVTSGSSHAVL